MTTTRIKYTCKKCGWSKSITKEWKDIRPKKCGNKKCKVIFLLNPEELQIDEPQEAKEKPCRKKKSKA